MASTLYSIKYGNEMHLKIVLNCTVHGDVVGLVTMLGPWGICQSTAIPLCSNSLPQGIVFLELSRIVLGMISSP